ncbi:MAG: VTT domain-containing protein [Candidatus Bathyarchaeota archaeon]|nr:VTT domain-containing protein [Candidatus Bathyarchaeota archaeon]
MSLVIGLITLFLTSFGLGLIPFAGPSTLFIASNAVLLLGVSDAPTLAAVACLVAFGSALAKSVHYMVTFYASNRLSPIRQQRLNASAQKINRWAFLLLFGAASTPIPDDPIVIPLGLIKYSPYKFFLAYFLGKIIITLTGAFIGSWTGQMLSEWLTPEVTIASSIILTVVFTVILLKVDLGKLTEKILRKKHEAVA